MSTETNRQGSTETHTESSHTPSPWIAYPETVKVGRNPVCNRIAVFALDEDGPCGHVDFSDANANLISAAPDLLEALKRMWLASTNFSCVPSDSDVQCAAKAIAKAEGRS